jgi:6-phosphogluconate dehydrogenase
MERHEGSSVGVVGLARMGNDVALRLTAHGHKVVGYDPIPASAEALIQAGGRHVDSLARLVAALPAPRLVWAQLPAGVVDDLLATLQHLLEEGDVLLDASESYYCDTLRRVEPFAEAGVHLVDIGVSGGSWSRTQGYALLVGGTDEAVAKVRPVLDALAEDGERGWAHVGGPGTGHFARMVQEGVQYGVAQAIAEGVAMLECKGDLKVNGARVLEVWAHASPLRSRLLDLTAHGMTANPQLEGLTPYLDDSAQARWAAAEAIEMECPAPVITAALQNRFRSRVTNSRSDRALALMRRMIGGLGAREP